MWESLFFQGAAYLVRRQIRRDLCSNCSSSINLQRSATRKQAPWKVAACRLDNRLPLTSSKGSWSLSPGLLYSIHKVYVDLYSAFLRKAPQMHSDMDHTVLPANYTMPAFTSQPQSITALWLVLILPHCYFLRYSWPQAAPRWDSVEHSADSHRRSHWRVGATTTSLRQSKSTSL